MSTPHDYYHHHGDRPNLRSRGNSRHYVEPDYIANEAGDQLPMVSSLGAGPRGRGITVKQIESEYGFTFAVLDDVTGEAILQTPDLDAGTISITPSPVKPNDDQEDYMSVTVTKNGVPVTYDIPLYPGGHGSRIYMAPGAPEKAENDLYMFNLDDLTAYQIRRGAWEYFPHPRVNDVIGFVCVDENKIPYMAFANVVAVEYLSESMPEQVIAICRNYIPFEIPVAGDNGNWWINGNDTGVPTTAKIDIKSTETAEYGDPAEVRVDFNEETSTNELTFVIPEGKPGRFININSTVYESADDLPAYDSVELGDAFIVKGLDPQYDLYIKGATPASDELPWMVVNDWQGKPGIDGTRIFFLDTEMTNIDTTINLNGGQSTTSGYNTPEWVLIHSNATASDIAVGVYFLDKSLYLWKITNIFDDLDSVIFTMDTNLKINWSVIDNPPATYPPSAHNHDGRYYTKDEVNGLIQNLTNLINDINTDITNLASNLNDNYYDSETIDGLMDDLAETIPTQQNLSGLGADVINSMFPNESE